MSLRVGEKPFPPDHFYLSACQNEPVEKYTIPVPEGQKIQWLGAKPDISTEQVQTYALPFAYENAAGCRSETAQFYVEIKSLPGLPFNTTPPTAIDAVQFSAEGQNLRWYSSQTSKQGLSYAPHYLGPGKKTHYVSQTVGCESPRLKIETEIVPGLKIVSQPRSQGNCEGNTLTFSVRATGPEHLEYLRISPVSDSLTVRCRIQSGADILYSEPAKLDIYKVLSAPSQVQICGTDSVHAHHLKIQGEVKNIEWQLQQGTKYLTLPPDALVTGTYRARVIFASGCIRYSGTFSVEKLPEPIFTGFPRTCPENTWGAYKRELAFTVLEEVDDQLEISQLTGQTFSARSPEGCPLKLPAFKPEYLPVPPPVPLEWTLPLFSQLPPHTWIKEDVWVSMDRLVDTLVRSYAVRTNCLSKPGILRAMPVPRYYPAEKDSTFSFDEEPVYFDEKYHTFTREGEVILSADLPIPYGKLETHPPLLHRCV